MSPTLLSGETRANRPLKPMPKRPFSTSTAEHRAERQILQNVLDRDVDVRLDAGHGRVAVHRSGPEIRRHRDGPPIAGGRPGTRGLLSDRWSGRSERCGHGQPRHVNPVHLGFSAEVPRSKSAGRMFVRPASRGGRQLGPMLCCSLSIAWSIVKEAGRWLGGNSWKVDRKRATPA